MRAIHSWKDVAERKLGNGKYEAIKARVAREVLEADLRAIRELNELADGVTICREAEIDAAERGLSESFRGNLALARMLAEEELRRALAPSLDLAEEGLP